MDAVCLRYYRELGHDLESKHRVRERVEIYAVERLPADHRQCVFSLGAGHSFYEDGTCFARAQRALAPFANVVLLLPALDTARAATVLHGRSGGKRAAYERMVTHRSNHDLATHTICTDGRSPEETCAEILRRTLRSEASKPFDTLGLAF